jgi:hypothetical protein
MTDYNLGIDHIQGQGRLIALNSCKVVFDFLWPVDIVRTPYFVLVSTGEHNHIPPPIHKLPQTIRDDLKTLFIRMNDYNLTKSM